MKLCVEVHNYQPSGSSSNLVQKTNLALSLDHRCLSAMGEVHPVPPDRTEDQLIEET